MSCFSPLDGWMSTERTPLGKRRVVFAIRESFHDLKVTVPCGQCIGCRLERARQWALRCVHEAKLWKENSFVTLTYRDLPAGGSLLPRDFVLFMKRLRKSREPTRLRFLQAGEYGELGRPHHHALLFNCGFPDRKVVAASGSGEPIFRSAELEELWPHGFSSIGTVTEESAAYVARYTVAKIREVDRAVRKEASGNRRYDEKGRRLPYITMSRRPGIGALWLDKFYSDVYPRDVMISPKGVKGRPPRFYDDRMREKDPALFARLKRKRVDSVNAEEQRTGRLIARQENVSRRVQDFLKRGL